ncbi:hypothetical protein Mal4_49820 [Maioricimonas rarisocia]|uniref:Uncharacterized protein n=1 Tax=Maioricimonas rarisocia TaxID=2528026 RepID=A0A517ZDS6_9PLAN|nr:hypothetical protein [Maioricimonas rarisocia]QDU40624.1 hypothetical protein Mal4_49820 [Maioricimonas rarisocia]
MPDSAQTDRYHIGFLRVVEVSGAGFVGGLLVSNRFGKPLEFQCTTPVKANRVQELLYGPTLRPFLFAELIGKTLFERLAVKPDLILVSQPELIDLRRHVKAIVACTLDEETGHALPDEQQVQLGQRTVRIHPEYLDDVARLQKAMADVPADADLSEPLDRVRDALQETLRSVTAA